MSKGNPRIDSCYQDIFCPQLSLSLNHQTPLHVNDSNFAESACCSRACYATDSAYVAASNDIVSIVKGLLSRVTNRAESLNAVEPQPLSHAVPLIEHICNSNNMGLPPSPASETSLVSVDPAIAQQISRSKSSHQDLTSKAERRRSTSIGNQQTQKPEQAPVKEIAQGKPLPKSLERTRKNSLRRVKNSTEILRQRSTRAQHESKPSDGAPALKGGRNFTVGNVGTGGKLYLRCAAP
jgi:hypothetical protein